VKLIEARKVNVHAALVKVKSSQLPFLGSCLLCQNRHFQGAPMEHRFTVTGMTCGHCEMAVTRALKQLDASAQVKIDRSQNLVEVQSSLPRQELAAAIQQEGYTVAN
jgi:copper chaperone